MSAPSRGAEAVGKPSENCSKHCEFTGLRAVHSLPDPREADVNWNRLWGASNRPVSNEASAQPSPELRAALGDLDRLSNSRPELAEPATSLKTLLSAAFGGSVGEISPALDRDDPNTAFLIERIREGWVQRVPAVRSITPKLDSSIAFARLEAVAMALPMDNPAAVMLLKAVRRQDCRPDEWLARTLAGGDQELATAASEAGLSLDPLRSVVRLVLLAELSGWSARIGAELEGVSWAGEGCPICGAWPALAESRGLEQRRFLRCDQCAGGWPAGRMSCPFCGEDDHRALQQIYVEGEQDRQRLVVCARCNGRLKVFATISPLAPPSLLVAELAMAHLDMIELEQPSHSAPPKSAGGDAVS